jgi:hypothetical protein
MVDFLHSAAAKFPSNLELHSAMIAERVKIRETKHVQRVVSKLYNDVVNRFNIQADLTRRLQIWFLVGFLAPEHCSNIPVSAIPRPES